MDKLIIADLTALRERIQHRVDCHDLNHDYAAWTGVPYWMLARQISKETTGDVLSARWNPDVVNYLGAVGLGQVMPENLDMSTDRGRQFAKSTNDGQSINARDPETAIRVTARHLADMVKWTGSWRMGLMAYNGGAGHWINPRRYGDWQPESIDYARAILGDVKGGR